MNIENDLFKRMKPNIESLLIYGFIKDKSVYKYSKVFMNGSFRADILIDENETVSGKVFDLSVDYEYTNFRVDSQTGEFVNKVREEYKSILEDIAKKCFIKEPFIFEQSNRLAKMIKNRYSDDPEFIWEKLPGYGVFRNKDNRKWYALVMNIDRSKLKDGKGEVEIINIKLDENKTSFLLKKRILSIISHEKEELDNHYFR